ncbi:MAG: M56 family metallopeptidase [Planctomycetota bacterium]
MVASELMLVGWLVTYLLHSTVLLGTTWLVLRRCHSLSDHAQEFLWRCALLGGFLTATLQLHAGLGPLGQLDLELPAATTAPAAATAPAAEPGVFPGMDAMAALPDSDALGDAAAGGGAEPILLLALPILLGLWAVGLVVAVLRHMGRRLRLGWMLRDRRPVPPGRLQVRFLELKRRAGLGPRTRLTTSGRIRCPMAFGVLRPEICLPRSMVHDMQFHQQGCVLAHELAHLRAWDPTWLLLQSVVSWVGWLQPLNRLALRRLHDLAEYRCDAWAVRHAGSRVQMAKALIKVAESYVTSGEPMPVYAGVNAMAVGGSALGRRVQRILASGQDTPGRLGRSVLCGIVVLGLGAVALAVPGLSVSPRPVPRPAVRIPATDQDPADQRLDSLRRIQAELAGLQAELDGIRDALGSLQTREVRSILAKLQGRIRQLQREQEELWQEAVHAAGSGKRTRITTPSETPMASKRR